MNSLYLLLNIAVISLPISFSFGKKIFFRQYWPYLSSGIVFAMFIFIPLDIMFTKIGVWGFNEKYLLGLRFFTLPIEEWLFFITIPYAGVFLFETIRAYLPKLSPPGKTRFAVLIFASGLFVIAMLNPGLYTSVTFIGLSILMVSYQVVSQRNFWAYFLLTYVVFLLPYLLVDGILTGTFLGGNVVWYNDQQNLGIRIFTVPAENIFYGMFLLLTVLIPYEFLKNRFSNSTKV